MNCKVCDSEKTEIWFDDKDYFTCLDCDCIFRSRLFTNTILLNQNNLKQKLGVIISKRFWNVVANQYVKYLKTKTGLKFKTAFDIGSAYGHFVKKLEDYDINAEGIEKDQRTYDRRVTDKIKFGLFKESTNLENKYDLISFTQMIYYLDDPITVLNNAKKFLNDNGFIFIATYSVISPFFKKYPKVMEGVNIMLSRKNFENLVGFKIIDFTNFRSDLFLERRKQSTVFNEIKNYIKYHFKQPFTEFEKGQMSFILLQISD
jgi:SAM-dependent methyltransferase